MITRKAGGKITNRIANPGFNYSDRKKNEEVFLVSETDHHLNRYTPK
jgi:hypothetical protein